MGSLRYDGQAIDFEDADLMELMVVTTARLRRNEPFLLSWWTGVPGDSVRNSLWMHPGTNLTWTFEGREPAVDRERVNRMLTAAGSSRGLLVNGRPALLGGPDELIAPAPTNVTELHGAVR